MWAGFGIENGAVTRPGELEQRNGGERFSGVKRDENEEVKKKKDETRIYTQVKESGIKINK